VTFTATVTFLGGPYSGGLLRFTADGVPLAGPPGGITPDANGQGSLTTSMLAAGSHQIVASFTPNGNNFVDSAPLTQHVSEAPTTTSTTTTTALTTTIPVSTTTTPTSSTSTTAPGRVDTVTELSSSLNPSVVGQPVTFTATVAPVGGSGFAPLRSRSGPPFPRQVADGGTLTISDGDTVLAVVPVEAGRGAFTTSALSPGTHTITAAFSGTVTDEPSSTALTQQVNQPARLPATR
jgi:hypothetical protein